MIRGTDGLDYENITEKLLGNPADTPRNQWLSRLRKGGKGHSAVLALPWDATGPECLNAFDPADLAERNFRTGKAHFHAGLARFNAAVAGFNAKSAELGSRLSGRRPHTVIFDEYANPPAPAHPAGSGAEGTC